MVNEDKVRLMAKAASYENGEGRKALSVNRMFRGDYISIHMIGAWLCYTIAFALCIVLWALYNMEYLMDNINQIDLISMGRNLVLLYVLLLAVYLVINYAVFHLKYRRYREGLVKYNHILKKLAHIYGSAPNASASKAGGKEDDEDFVRD